MNETDNDTVEFTPEAITTYLDEAITYWRGVRDQGEPVEQKMATFYIDAFQSVRTSLFGETLPPDES